MAKQTKHGIIALDLPQAELSAPTKAYFAKAQEKLGMIPNVLQAYAFDEKKLRAFTDMYNDLMLGDSVLTKLEREMIAVVVSSINHCYYCLTAHGAAVRQLSGDPMLGEMMVMNYRAADLTPKQRAMLDFAVKLTETPAKVDDADGPRCARRALTTVPSGTSPRPLPSSTCRTEWRRRPTCAPTTNIMRWRDEHGRQA
jgi:uncharacterized peroxidase-related enzyme